MLRLLKKITVRFCRETTLHGVRYLVLESTHKAEKVFWLAVVLVSIGAAVAICVDNWDRFQSRPTVTLLQVGPDDWEMPYPTFTACYNAEERIDAEFAAAFIKQTWGVSAKDNAEKFGYYMHYVSTVAKFAWNDSSVEPLISKLQVYEKDPEILRVSMLDMVVAVHPELDLRLCVGVGSDESIGEFTLTMTEAGLCSTFNSPISHVLSVNQSHSSQKPSTYQPDSYVKDKTGGTLYLTSNHPLILYINSPYEVLDSTRAYSDTKVVLSPYYSPRAQFTAEWTVTQDNINSLSPEQRRCRQIYEPQDDQEMMYSKRICQMVERTKRSTRYCECRPFFLNVLKNVRVCRLDELLNCVFRNNSKAIFYDPHSCLSPCLQLNFMKFHEKQLPVTEKSIPSYVLELKLPKVRYVRQVAFSADDLLVSFGGAAALFLGCSLLTLTELVYYLLIVCYEELSSKRQRRRRVVPKRKLMINYEYY